MNKQKPTAEFVANYITKFDNENSHIEIAINNLINKFPKNTHIEDVIPKVATINSLYNTFIPNIKIADMAKHIVNKNIDSKIDLPNNLQLVEEIAIGHNISNRIGINPSRFYSFATKYCNWHRQNIFPIYDRYTKIALISLRDDGYISKFNDNAVQNYEKLYKIIFELIEKCSLGEYNLKQIDKFLWIYGQEVFQHINK
jgi:hypothetical protein